MYCYRQQIGCVKHGTDTSSFLVKAKGVRQGAILSPFLFAVYTDDISHLLNNCKVDVM